MVTATAQETASAAFPCASPMVQALGVATWIAVPLVLTLVCFHSTACFVVGTWCVELLSLRSSARLVLIWCL